VRSHRTGLAFRSPGEARQLTLKTPLDCIPDASAQTRS
jgi:hypothetical protein